MISRRKFTSITVASVLLFLLPMSTVADTPQPQDFFKNGYVKGTLESDKRTAPREISSRTRNHGIVGKSKEAKGNTEEASDEFKSPTFYQDTIDEDALHDTGARIPISKVTYITNGETELETYEHIKVFSDFLIEYELEPQRIHFINRPKVGTQDPPRDWLRLLARGGTITFGIEMAERYNIEKMPAWLFHTENGDIVLEGYDDVSKFMSADGKLKKSLLFREEQVNKASDKESTDETKS